MKPLRHRPTILCLLLCVGSLLSLPAGSVLAADGNRLTYLNETHPYVPGTAFPKLITPQWVGEPGVEAVVVLAIDDMRDTEKYEAYLRPILQRLKEIDGRAPVSIMTCRVKPDEAQLRSWLDEGLSIEIHTRDHPCPLLKDGDFAKARETYEACVDQMFSIPGNAPVAYRMPCCDSLNTVSPRFYTEIFNRTTPEGHFLQVDTSVFNVFTDDDPEIPRELLFDADGKPKFEKYVPYDRSFVNTIENYPYPYVINRLCWQFPCLAPSDWSAQHYHQQVNDERTLADLKTALDITVLKQGTLNLVFHPHGWIRNDQIVDLIDHAVAKHGRKVKFLTFRETLDRLNQHLLGGGALRNADGSDAHIRLIDVDGDGYMDVWNPASRTQFTRLWQPATGAWRDVPAPSGPTGAPVTAEFGVLDESGRPSMLALHPDGVAARTFDSGQWTDSAPLRKLFAALKEEGLTVNAALKGGLRFRDLDGDCLTEALVAGPHIHAIFRWDAERQVWDRLPFTLPDQLSWRTRTGGDAGLRFVDVDEDGRDDVLFSDAERYGLWLWKDLQTGWSTAALTGKRGDGPAEQEIPPVVRGDGSDNGVWFHSRHLWVQNEDTAGLPNLVDRRPYGDLLRNVPAQPKSPAAALKSMFVKPGFEIQLAAAEPLIQDPVAIDWGPDGKLWVAEMADYPSGPNNDGPPLGRVRYLEDQDGDGVYDKSTLFLDNIPYPNGVLAWKRGVLVSAAPDVFYAEDQNGDGQADLRDVLYTGFNPGNPQHRANGFRRGLDNWLHLANGDSGGTVRSTRTGESVDIRGRDVRIHPDSGRIETTAGQTQFGRNRDDWGNWFGCNNSHPVFHYVLDEHYLKRNPHYAPPASRTEVRDPPGNAPIFPRSVTLERFNDFHTANRFTSACSTNPYRDTLFGPGYYGNLFTCEPVHNLVSRSVVEPRGVSFTARRADDEQESEFLASSDNWFRPAQVRTGPDGALWVVDMYRYVIEHPEWIPEEWQQRLDLRAGQDRGRIYRIVPVGQQSRAVPRLAELSTVDLVQALNSPSGWQRDLAQELLIQRGDAAATAPLREMAAGHMNPLTRLHALCTLAGLESLDAELLLPRLQDQHPGIRRHAVRLAEALLDTSPDLAQALAKLVADGDPHVRLQLAYSLGEWHEPAAGGLLGQLAVASADDPYLLAAVMSSLNGANVAVALDAVLADPSAPQAVVAGLIAQAVAGSDPETLTSLLKMLTADETEATPARRLQNLEAALTAADRYRRNLQPILAADEALAARVSKQFDLARTLVRNRDEQQADPALRALAIRLLVRDRSRAADNVAILGELLSPQYPRETQSQAVSGLASFSQPAAAQALLQGWNGYSPNLKSEVLDALLGREAWIGILLDAVEEQSLAAAEIDAARRQRLLGHRNPQLRERAESVLAAAVDPNRRKVVEHYAAAVPSTGDAAKGKAVFQKRCSVCHRLEEQGTALGPDLASLKDRSRSALLTAVFDPNRAVETKYIAYVAVTQDGKSHTGILAGESGNSVTLAAQEGKSVTLLRSEIEELVSSRKSLMPEGLEKDVTPEEVGDLLAYLDTIAAPPKQFPGNEPRLLAVGPDGVIELPATAAEIYGPSLVYEAKFQNLGYWSSPQDYAVWTFEVPEPGVYDVRLHYACPPDTAGNTLVLNTGDQQVTAEIRSTGNWNTYSRPTVGRLKLAAGRHRLTVSATPELTGALGDLRMIWLLPVQE